MKYAYLAWVALLGIAWLVVYLSKKGLRGKILLSSLVALPFGFGELYYFSNYWTPQTLFDLGLRYHLSVESFFLMFFLGGTAAFVYESVFKEKYPLKEKVCGKVCKCNWSFISALVLFILLLKLFPKANIIYPSSFATLGAGLVAFIIYPHLRKHVVFGGVLYMTFYGISLLIIELFFPGWIGATWNLELLSGILVFGVPAEELLFGFAFGTFWAPLYEEVCGRMKKLSYRELR